MALNNGIWDPKLRGTNIKGTNLKSLMLNSDDCCISLSLGFGGLGFRGVGLGFRV